MPKTNHIIPNFRGGLVLDVASEDLPDGVLTNNTRNVHTNRSGNLIGFGSPAAYLTGTHVSNPVYSGKHNETDGQRLFHVENQATPRIRSYPQGLTTLESVNFPAGVTYTNRKISHVQRLNHLILGTGDKATDKPLWYGRHNHTQFGIAPGATRELIEAQLFSPTQISATNNFPRALRAVAKGTKHYMISADTPYVYRFNGTSLELRSPAVFGKLTAITTDDDPDHVWVFDKQTQALYRLDGSLQIVSTIFVEGLPEDGREVTDLKQVSGSIYLLRSAPDDSYQPMENWLYLVDRTEGSANSTAKDISPIGFADFGIEPLAAQAPNITRWDLQSERIRPLVQGLYVSSGIVYMMFHYEANISIREEITDIEGTREYDVTYNDYRDWFLASQATPASEDLCGNLFMVRLGSTAGPYRVAMSNVRLAVGERAKLAAGKQVSSHTTQNIYAPNADGKVYRLSRTFDWTGDTHMTFTATELTGFGSILPVFSTNAPVQWWATNYPPQTGVLTVNAASGIVASDATLQLKEIPAGFIDPDKTYYYATSLIYDGYMESPLSEPVTSKGKEGAGFSLEVKVPQSNINRRVTAMNIYRAEGSDSGREEFYRQVGTISMTAAPTTDTIGGQPVYVFTFNDTKKMYELGPAYTSNSGLPETLVNNLPHYGVSTGHEDMLFIGDCYHPDIPESRLLIFRSQPYVYCSFNVETDVCRLDGVPLAMASYGGRVFACDAERMYMIDPVNMVVDEKIEGMNALNAYCMIATDFGIIAAGTDHVRLFNGKTALNISDRIRIHPGADLDAYSANPAADTSHGIRDYQYFAENASNIHCVHNSAEKTFGIYGTIGTDTIGYIYSLERGEWSRQVKLAQALIHSVSLNNGEVVGYYGSKADLLYGEHLGTNYDSYIAELAPFDGDDQNIDKWYYEIRVDYMGLIADLNVQLSVDGGAFSANLAQPEKGRYVIPSGSLRQGKSLRVRLTGTAKVRSVSIIYRPKIVRS